MSLSLQEKAARISKLTEWYEALGVKVSKERLRATLNATFRAPYDVWCQALAELLLAKNDGYATAPQVGEIWDRCKVVARKRPGGLLEWNATSGQWSEPDWVRLARRDQFIASGGDFSRLSGSRAKSGQTLQDVAGETLTHNAPKETGE